MNAKARDSTHRRTEANSVRKGLLVGRMHGYSNAGRLRCRQILSYIDEQLQAKT